VIPLPPLQLTGNPQTVDLPNNVDACCALLANESPYALQVSYGQGRSRWLGAWTADTFALQLGIQSLTLKPAVVGSLINAPSSVLLVTLAQQGEQFEGTYPMALTRQTNIGVGGVSVINADHPTAVVIENGAAVPLGDTSTVALLADKVTETCTNNLTAQPTQGAIASYKPVAGQLIALVGAAGPVRVGDPFKGPTQVSPLFGQATTLGNFLNARVTASASASQEPTTTAAGWVKRQSRLGSAGWLQIWDKANCAANEAPPVFTCNAPNGVSLMVAQLAEFSNVLTASPQDQNAGADGVQPGTVATTNPATDGGAGDLVVSVTKFGGVGTFPAAFSDAFNNGGVTVQTGHGDDSALFKSSNFCHSILPAVAPNLPLGIAPWRYDADGNNAPATGSKASVVLAASSGKAYTCHTLVPSILQTTAAPAQTSAQLLDGATIVLTLYDGVAGVIGNSFIAALVGITKLGTLGNSMTGQASSASTGTDEAIYIGCYLR
jgi:hypothetical protein